MDFPVITHFVGVDHLRYADAFRWYRMRDLNQKLCCIPVMTKRRVAVGMRLRGRTCTKTAN